MPIETAVQLLLKRRTKIVATLGPRTIDAATIARLTQTGVNVFRLEMWCGEPSMRRNAIELVRAASEEARASTALLAEVGGRSMRVGKLSDGGVTLTEGEEVTVTTRDVRGDRALIPCRYERLARDVQTGDRILAADGLIELRVERAEGENVACTVVRGGVLEDDVGINLPGVDVSAPCLGGEDADDARFALDFGVDFLTLASVRRADEVRQLRELVKESGKPCKIIAKIGHPGAVDDYDAILDAADAILIARCDLGVEFPLEQVPIVQRQLIDQARAAHKPVIVASQMLDSMVTRALPTRAEVADVSTAVQAGADAVMLSAETAVGEHPLAAVEMIDRIARRAEGYQWGDGAFESLHAPPPGDHPIPTTDAVARSAAQLSRDLRVRAIMVVAEGNVSAVTVSSARPGAPVVSLSSDARTCRWENLLWGVVPVFVEGTDLSDPEFTSRKLATELELAGRGDKILLVRGRRERELTTSSITILEV